MASLSSLMATSARASGAVTCLSSRVMPAMASFTVLLDDSMATPLSVACAFRPAWVRVLGEPAPR
eukprot:31370-Eustigmatos_ZCMA.PRE.1